MFSVGETILCKKPYEVFRHLGWAVLVVNAGLMSMEVKCYTQGDIERGTCAGCLHVIPRSDFNKWEAIEDRPRKRGKK